MRPVLNFYDYIDQLHDYLSNQLHQLEKEIVQERHSKLRQFKTAEQMKQDLAILSQTPSNTEQIIDIQKYQEVATDLYFCPPNLVLSSVKRMLQDEISENSTVFGNMLLFVATATAIILLTGYYHYKKS